MKIECTSEEKSAFLDAILSSELCIFSEGTVFCNYPYCPACIENNITWIITDKDTTEN